jgi:hypothetical protein
MTMFPLNFNPDLIMLPCKASIRDTGHALSFAQAADLVAHGQTRFIKIEHCQDGAPDSIGWTIFKRQGQNFVHTGDPLFDLQYQAHRYMRTAYAIWHNLNGSDATTYSHAHL